MTKTRLCAMIIGITLIALAVSAVPATAQMGVWRDINPDAYISPPANPQLNSVYMFSSAAGWAVGDSRPTTNTTTALPAIYHYDGSTWNLVPAPKIADFPIYPGTVQLDINLLWASRESSSALRHRWMGCRVQQLHSHVYGGPPPSVLAIHWDGITWRSQLAGFRANAKPNAGPLWSDFMVSSTDVWAVGQDQAGNAWNILALDWYRWVGWRMEYAASASSMSQLCSSGICGIYSVFMVSSTEGWAVGAGGMLSFTTLAERGIRSPHLSALHSDRSS